MSAAPERATTRGSSPGKPPLPKPRIPDRGWNQPSLARVQSGALGGGQGRRAGAGGCRAQPPSTAACGCAGRSQPGRKHRALLVSVPWPQSLTCLEDISSANASKRGLPASCPRVAPCRAGAGRENRWGGQKTGITRRGARRRHGGDGAGSRGVGQCTVRAVREDGLAVRQRQSRGSDAAEGEQCVRGSVRGAGRWTDPARCGRPRLSAAVGTFVTIAGGGGCNAVSFSSDARPPRVGRGGFCLQRDPGIQLPA